MPALLALLTICIPLASTPAHAGDPLVGMALFNNIPDAIISCGNSSCHGPNPNDNVNGLQKAGNNGGVIEAAIRVKVPPMMFLNGLLSPIQFDDLAAYLAPQPDLSDTVLAFGTQPLGTPAGTQRIKLRNLGGVDLAVNDITMSGPDAASFALGGNCSTVTALPSATISRQGGECELEVSFTPSAARTHQASLTLSYAGTTTFPSKQTIALSGTGGAPAVASIGVDPSSIDFGEVLRQAPAAPRSIVVSNPGTATLSISAVDTAGLHGGEFGLSGSCVAGIFTAPVQVAPTQSCSIVVSFSPQGAGPRDATLSIRHSASVGGGLVVVALHGFGTQPSCSTPQPAAEFQALSCPAGQTGSVTQSRTYACSGSTWVPGPFVTVGDTCRTGAQSAPLALVEYYNDPLDHYFVTADPAERAAIESGLAGPGWTRTATLGRVWDPSPASAGRTAICRFYGNPEPAPNGQRIGPNSHFYTADPDECVAVKLDRGWVFEGVVFAAVAANAGTCPEPLVAVRRNYNGRFRENDSNHRYSTDVSINAQMTARGWSDEGVVFCVER